MKNILNRVTVALVVLAAAAGSSALAQDLGPSWRGQPGSGQQTWRFDTGANPATPEVTTGAPRIGKASVAPGQFSMGWQPQLAGLGAGGSGFWDLGRNGGMTLTLTNPAGVPFQRISVQVSQWLDGGIYNDLAVVSVPGATPDGGDVGLGTTVSVGGWFVDATEWIVPAGATVDQVVISGVANGSVIDQIVVDTLSPVTQPPVTLSIRPLNGTTNMVEVSWSAPADSYVLESTTNLVDAQSWETVDAPVIVNGDLHRVPIDSTGTARFFRLKQR